MARSRYTIAHVLGRIPRWLGRLEARYVGMATTHGQHVLAAIAYHGYRLPWIIMPMLTKSEQMIVYKGL
jgi:hypothetical protein